MRNAGSLQTEFEIEVREDRTRCILRLIGELDTGGTEKLVRALHWADEGTAESILVDLDQLTFIDSAGLRVLVLANGRGERATRPLRFTRGSGQVARVLEQTALDRVLKFVDAHEAKVST